jgi:hypothetical protein
MAGALRPQLQLSASLIGIEPTALAAPGTASRHSLSHSRLWREQALGKHLSAAPGRCSRCDRRNAIALSLKLRSPRLPQINAARPH